MPQMANIVVKSGNGTTDVTLNQLSAASGDGGLAQWRGSAASPALASNLRCKSGWNKARTVRQVELTGDMPVIASVAGVDQIVARISMRTTFQVPMAAPSISAKDAAAVLTNALASTLIKEVIETGFAPT